VGDYSIWLGTVRPSSTSLQASGQTCNGGRSERSQNFYQRPRLDLGVCFSSWRMLVLLCYIFRRILRVDAVFWLCNIWMDVGR
jgi:hypothetical protein